MENLFNSAISSGTLRAFARISLGVGIVVFGGLQLIPDITS